MAQAGALLREHHIVHRPGLNEELAATAAFGTQMLHEVPGARYDGVFALWYGKAPGVDRTGDAFHHHNFRGVGRHGGVLAVAGDDPHARSTIFPSDSSTAFYKFYMPVLAPGNLQEVIDFGQHGFALSRASGLWVGFKFVTDIADSAALAWVGPDRVRPVLPEVMLDGAPLRPALRANLAGPPMLETERVIYHGQLEIARRYAALNGLNRVVSRPARARIGLLASGKTWYDLRQALRDLGLDDDALAAHGIALLKIGMLFPLEPGVIREFARGLEEIVVIEDKRPFLELFVKDILYAEPERPRVTGKTDDSGAPLLPAHGELSADAIARALLRRLGNVDTPQAQLRARLLSQPPYARIVETFGADARVHWHLHPAFLRCLGVRHKLRIGAWFRPAQRALAWGKRLRGTWIDLFRRAQVRRVERALIGQYEASLDGALAVLTPANHACAVELAGLPDGVRGYEAVKLASVTTYLQRVRETASELEVPIADAELRRILSER